MRDATKIRAGAGWPDARFRQDRRLHTDVVTAIHEQSVSFLGLE